eukprot:5312690-Pleurochrysis_carterae.AAC.1
MRRLSAVGIGERTHTKRVDIALFAGHVEYYSRTSQCVHDAFVIRKIQRAVRKIQPLRIGDGLLSDEPGTIDKSRKVVYTQMHASVPARTPKTSLAYHLQPFQMLSNA